MKTILFLFISSIYLTNFCFAQSLTISPNSASSIIEANSTTNGFLPPRMTTNQRNNLSATNGLMIYCTDCTPAGHYGYIGGAWKPMFDYLTAAGPCVQYTVGQQAQGGTVIWVDDSGQHGLVAAPVDMSRPETSPAGTFTHDFFPWAVNIELSNTTFTMAQRVGIYGGQVNTEKIIEKFGWSEYAAFLCTQKNWGGYGDWYLPSIDELIILYSNRNYLPTPLNTSYSNLISPNKAYSDYYWSSTEAAANTAYILRVARIFDLPAGNVGTVYKGISVFEVATPMQENYVVHVRAVRRF